MTYRLDPQIDERLARLIDGLPVTGRAPASAELAARARKRRAGTVIRVVFVAALAALALPATIWLGHTGPLPSSAALRCTDVDPFRCHDSAAKSVAALRSAAGKGFGPLITQLAKSGFTTGEIDVRADFSYLHFCDTKSCPAQAVRFLSTIAGVDIVTIHYASKRPLGRAMTGWVELQVTRYRNGLTAVGPAGFIGSPGVQ
jgi:hypothetical protein